MKHKKIAFLFPGQGAQYPGMGKDFAEAYPIAKETFQEADELLHRHLSQVIWNGPETVLVETRNSQSGIFVTSVALMRVLNQLFPTIIPTVAAGLSLGEYSALVAAKKIPFDACLNLVEKRGLFMNEACEKTSGTMAVVIGLDGGEVEEIVKEISLPNDLWTANFNCPGQVVISGTHRGIEVGSAKVKEKGAKRVIPLQVHGAFHSGLMSSAEERLKVEIDLAPIIESPIDLVMNFSGHFVNQVAEIKRQLVKQVTHSVRWEQGIRTMMSSGIDLFIEIGCGKTLNGMNRRIGVTAPSLNLEKISDFDAIALEIGK